MRFLSIAVTCLLTLSLSTSASTVLDSQVYGIHELTEDVETFLKYLQSRAGISQCTYHDLVQYTKYSSAVYQRTCPHPLGNILVEHFENDGTQGFVVRDDCREEIVVAFAGTLEIVDLVVDILIVMSPLRTIGVDDVGDAYVHPGFLSAYNAVASTVLDTIEAQVATYPSYKIVVTGHSMGGAVASIAALSIKAAVPKSTLKLYTFGQPRTGNAAFASLVESRIGTSNIFRVVHTNDGVPTALPTAVGYHHFANEFWNFDSLESDILTGVDKCIGGEDPKCSAAISSLFINPSHVYYFGRAMGIRVGDPSLCM